MAAIDGRQKQYRKKKLSGIKNFIFDKISSKQRKPISRAASMPVGLNLISNNTIDGWDVIARDGTNKRSSVIDSHDLLGIKPQYNRPQSECLDCILEKCDVDSQHVRKISSQSMSHLNSIDQWEDATSIPDSSNADADEWSLSQDGGSQYGGGRMLKSYSDAYLNHDENDNYFIDGNHLKSVKNHKNREVKKYRAPLPPSDCEMKDEYRPKQKQSNAVRHKRYKKYKAPGPPIKTQTNGKVKDVVDNVDAPKIERNESLKLVHRTRSFIRQRKRSIMDKKRRLSAESKDIFEGVDFFMDSNRMKYLIELEIEGVLLNKTYDQSCCTIWCKEISTKVRDKIRHKIDKNYKVVVSTFIGASDRSEQEEDTTHVAVHAITNPVTDKFLTVAFEGQTFFVWVTLCLFEY